MHTNVGRCSTSLLFVKKNVEKICLSSTEPKTCTMAISPTFKYSNMVFFKTIELDSFCHNFVTLFTSYGDFIAVVAHDYMVHLNLIT